MDGGLDAEGGRDHCRPVPVRFGWQCRFGASSVPSRACFKAIGLSSDEEDLGNDAALTPAIKPEFTTLRDATPHITALTAAIKPDDASPPVAAHAPQNDLHTLMLKCRGVVAGAGRFYIGVCEDYEERWDGRPSAYIGHVAKYDKMTRLGNAQSQAEATYWERQLIHQYRGKSPLCMNVGPGGEHVSVLGPWRIYIVWCWPDGDGGCIRYSNRAKRRGIDSSCTVADDLGYKCRRLG
jgi:hypothetical protein